MASSSSSTFSSSNKSHQVFINHRGVDVKKTFARSLYLRLREKGLTAFLDDEEMQVGYEISPQLADAIRTASVHVAIFSPRYAESDWCLNELLLMLKSNAPIIPVFYGISPADVRWMRGDYGKALQTHKEKPRNDPSTIEEWRNALHQVANNSGFELDKYNGQDLVLELLDKVVKRLLEMVPKPDLYVAEYPTGLDDKLKEFEDTVQLTQQQGRKPQILGIVGLGGVGKTTLATAFFNKKKSDYDRSCFLCDVRDHTTNGSLHVLQSQLLNSLIGFNKQVNSVREGKGMLIEPLKSCKAIVILDDVDDVHQVKAFLPQSDVLNSESLILITTRDKNVLRSLKVENSSIYSLLGLKKEHSLELFCSHAFSQAFPLPEFKSLVDKFIDYCNGLPLSLKIFGALLYGKDISQWEKEWESLRQIVPSAIQDTFKISYNSLNEQEKNIFLDIACFFVKRNRDSAISIWNSLGWRGDRGFLNLQDKSLVEVDEWNLIQIHDHLRDVGRQFAAASLPGRLVLTKNLIHNLSHQSSEITFRGIRMVPGEYSGQDDDDDVFGVVDTENAVLERSFRSVQILDMEGCHLEPILRKAKPPNLSWLRWNRCPHSSLPSWVSVKNLRILYLEQSELKALWPSRFSMKNLGALLWHWKSESQEPEKLEELRVSQSEKLRSITGLERATKLRLLDVSMCYQLEELPSLETLKSLEQLWANGCKKLKGIRASAQVTKLRELQVRACSELEELPSLETLVSLEQLWADGCEKLKGIRASAQVTKLRELCVCACSELEELPSLETLVSLEGLVADECKKLKGIRASAQVTKLRHLYVRKCCELEELPSLETLESLEDLRANGCKKLKGIRASAPVTKLRYLDVDECSELEELWVSQCEKLRSITGLERATKLRSLDVSMCYQLEELPSLETLVSLEQLWAKGCKKLKGIRASAHVTKLKFLQVDDCSELEELPSLETLVSLEDLRAGGCKKLKGIRASAQVTKLRILSVLECSELEELPSLETLVSLEELWAAGCKKLKGIRASAQVTTLRYLDVSNWSELEELPSLETLVSLEGLRANGCKKLKGIRASAQVTKLKYLYVDECSELEELPSLETLLSLEELQANGCKKLKGIRASAQMTKLRCLYVNECSELEELPSLETLVSLEQLWADGCKKLRGIRASAQVTKLKILNVSNCSELAELPSLETLLSLEELWANRCKKLKGIRASAQVTKLRILIVCGCYELEKLPSMETLVSLEQLWASKCVNLRSIWGLAQATNLRVLSVRECFDLEEVEGIEHCTWLERLDVSQCHKLVCPVWE